MILEKLSLSNFMCYSGLNEFEFSKGLNVIIGDNGYGKSKVYDAIYWCMYDQFYDTESEKFIYTSQKSKDIISDKAIHELESGSIECLVKLVFLDERKDDRYIIERSLSASKKSGESVNYFKKSNRRIFHKKAFKDTQFVDDSDEIDRILRRILPSNIKPYMWFQGEEIKNLIDFRSSDSLSKAINTLSDISTFDKIVDITERLYNSAYSALKTKKNSLSSDKTRSQELDKEIEEKNKNLANLLAKKQGAETEKEEAEERLSNFLQKLDVAKEINDLENQLNNTEEKFNKCSEDLENINQDFHKNLFNRGWLLKGTLSVIKEFENKYDDYIQHRANAKNKLDTTQAIKEKLNRRLPHNVPEPVYINQMLEKKECFVCKREAPEGSDAYNAIKELLEDTPYDLDKMESEISNFDFKISYKKLYQNALAYDKTIKYIDKDIENFIEKRIELENRRQDLNRKISDLEKNRNLLIEQNSISLNEAKKVTDAIDTYREIISDKSQDISYFERQIENLKKQIKTLEIEYEDLVLDEVPIKFTKKNLLTFDLFEIAKSTKKRVFLNLIKQLEDESNQHYKHMTENNLSSRGIIKIVEKGDNYMPILVDDNGKTLTQLNKSNKLLVKIATIMAIISARKTRDTSLYTLISDAPMSVFGDEYAIGFCKTLSKVYNQSIITSYEFYKNEKLRKQLLNDSAIDLGTSYLITPNQTEEERDNRNSLSTNIERIA